MTLKSENNLNRKHGWMIAYDISDHRQRRRVHSLLKDHGQRVQYSIFECELTKKQQFNLRSQLSECIEDDDSIRWYPLCKWCESRIDWIGNGQCSKSNDFHLL